MDATIYLSTLNMNIVISIDYGHSPYCKEFFLNFNKEICLHFNSFHTNWVIDA
jgi:hypothetical protein